MSSPIGDKPNFVVHSFPFYIADWRDSETRMRLSAEARGVYWELLPYCYREGSLPTERDALIKIAAVTPKEFDRCWPLIKPCFIEREGRLFNEKVTAVLGELERYHEQKSEAGRKSVQARRERKHNGRLNAALTDVGTNVQTEHIDVFKPSLPLPHLISSASSGGAPAPERERPEAFPEPDFLWHKYRIVGAKSLIEDIAARMLERHAKKGAPNLFETYFAEALSACPTHAEVFALKIEQRHQRWCEYWEKTCSAPQYWPKLAAWMSEGTYKQEPPTDAVAPSSGIKKVWGPTY